MSIMQFMWWLKKMNSISQIWYIWCWRLHSNCASTTCWFLRSLWLWKCWKMLQNQVFLQNVTWTQHFFLKLVLPYDDRDCDCSSNNKVSSGEHPFTAGCDWHIISFFWVEDFFPENFLKKLKKYRCVFQCTLFEHLKIKPTAPHQEIIRGWERIATLKEKGPLVREEHYGPVDNVWL